MTKTRLFGCIPILFPHRSSALYLAPSMTEIMLMLWVPPLGLTMAVACLYKTASLLYQTCGADSSVCQTHRSLFILSGIVPVPVAYFVLFAAPRRILSSLELTSLTPECEGCLKHFISDFTTYRGPWLSSPFAWVVLFELLLQLSLTFPPSFVLILFSLIFAVAPFRSCNVFKNPYKQLSTITIFRVTSTYSHF